MISASEQAPAILAWLRAREDLLADLALALTACESPTDDVQALEAIAELVREELESLDYKCCAYRPAASGARHMIAAPRGCRWERYQLMVGHLDTVWPIGTLASMPAKRSAGSVWGPGVFDMKGGIAQMLFALRALKCLELRPTIAPVLFLNTDEETGSCESWPHLRGLAKDAQRAFILEPAVGSRGALKTARMGVGYFNIEVHGIGAHSGLDPQRGVSAVHELANLVGQILRFADPPELTINVGVIRGGTRHNVTAEHAYAQLEVRALRNERMPVLQTRLSSLKTTDRRARVSISGKWDRPALERTPGNEHLWALARGQARALGFELEQATVGGASDGNLTSTLCPTLDGLGSVGEGAHASSEHILVEHMPARAALLAQLLLSDDVADAQRAA